MVASESAPALLDIQLTPSHMTCKKCKWEFCWVCMGPWSEHGTAWYQCNRYEEKTGVNARDAQAKSRASLERYLHVSPSSSCPFLSLTISSSIGGQITTILQNSMRSFTRTPRRKWSRCKIRETSRGSRSNSPNRQWISRQRRESPSSGRTAWPSSESDVPLSTHQMS